LDGSSTVKVDFLISNASDDPINIIRIIYPNRLYDLYPIGEDNGAVEVDHIKIDFSDISSTFITDAEDINWAYELPGSSVQIIQQDRTVPSWGIRRILQQSDPSNALKNLVFDGIVGEENDLCIEDSFTFTQLKILHNIYYTVLKYDLKRPMVKNQARWVRLKFKGKIASHNLRLIKHRRLRRITNTLYYQYQIFGPHDVKNRFITYLRSFKRRCEKGCSPNIVNDLLSLLHFFEEDGLIENGARPPSSTIFEKLFIHIDPGELERLTDITNEGAIQIAGFLPNIVFAGDRDISLYQWKVINNTPSPFYFYLLFQAKPFTVIYYIVPWASLLVAISALLATKGDAQGTI